MNKHTGMKQSQNACGNEFIEVLSRNILARIFRQPLYNVECS
jgi:hypothetical protein